VSLRDAVMQTDSAMKHLKSATIEKISRFDPIAHHVMDPTKIT
jgi:hypothetical protein